MNVAQEKTQESYVMFEDDSFLDLEFALNENRIVSSQMFLIITDKSNI